MEGRRTGKVVIRLKRGLDDDSVSVCCICMEKELAAEWRGLSCAPGHEMHEHCLRMWAKSQQGARGEGLKCPCCRTKIQGTIVSLSGIQRLLSTPEEIRKALKMLLKLRIRTNSLPNIEPWAICVTDEDRLVAACFADPKMASKAQHVAQEALRNRCDVNARDPVFGASAFGIACYFGNRAMLEVLIGAEGLDW